MTDNGSAYLSKAFRTAVAAAGLKHKRTRPYTPRTNGKAERFIQTSLREWAYARPYASSQERSMALIPGSTITISSGHTPPWPTIRPSSASANRSCLVRPKGPLLRPDLPPITTGAASRGQGSPEATGDRRRAASLQRHVAPVTLAQGGAHA